MKNVYVDIDNTICKTIGIDYPSSIPLPENIAKVNAMYDAGHTITLWTARGTKTGIDWYDLTYRQVTSWGVKFHELKMGKPAYDLFIDDLTLNAKLHWSDENVNFILK
jgi:hypothetical protein